MTPSDCGEIRKPFLSLDLFDHDRPPQKMIGNIELYGMGMHDSSSSLPVRAAILSIFTE